MRRFRKKISSTKTETHYLKTLAHFIKFDHFLLDREISARTSAQVLVRTLVHITQICVIGIFQNRRHVFYLFICLLTQISANEKKTTVISITFASANYLNYF